MPAMEFIEPLRLASCVIAPVGVAIAEGDEAFAFEPLQGLVIGRVIALAMRDADIDDLALGHSAW